MEFWVVGEPAHTVAGRPASFCFDPVLLDDRPPFLDIGFLHLNECLPGLLLAREHLISGVCKARANSRVCQRLYYCPVQCADDVEWCALGCENSEPV